MIRRAKVLLFTGLLIVPAAAFTFGGWSVITVVDVPESAVAGTPVEYTYEVRQHGMGLFDGLHGVVESSIAGTLASGAAQSLGNGRYRGQVTFPKAGQWQTRIRSGFGDSPLLLPITVVAAGTPAPRALTVVERGEHLFVAKGCVTCHSHQLTKERGGQALNVGPDLSEPKFMSAYLTKFLADPSVKTNWANANRMPNLGLKPAEVTALVAFLNRETRASQR